MSCAINIPRFFKGQSITLNVDFQTDVSLWDNVIFEVYGVKGVVLKYAWKTLEGYNTDDVTCTDELLGLFEIKIQSTDSFTLTPQIFVMEGKYQTDGWDGEFVGKFKENVFEILNASIA